MIDVLNVIKTEMINLCINYEYGIMSKAPPTYPYWVGDYIVSDSISEDGETNITFFINGFARNSYLEFEKEKAKIYEHFTDGITVIKNNTAISIQSGTIQNISEENAELKRCQIILSIKFWRGR